MTVFRVVTDPFPGLSALAELIDPAHPEDLEELIALRNETDDVMRAATIAAVSHVAPADRYAGPHAAIVMAPFMWLGASRFSAGAFGVLYTASALETAIRESAFHAQALTAASIGTPPAVLPRVALTLDLDATRHVDCRAIASKRGRRYPAGITAAVYDPDPHRYAPAQALGAHVRSTGAEGIRYDSVRDAGGECWATFRPAAVRTVSDLAQNVEIVWDGRRVLSYNLVTTYFIA